MPCWNHRKGRRLTLKFGDNFLGVLQLGLEGVRDLNVFHGAFVTEFAMPLDVVKVAMHFGEFGAGGIVELGRFYFASTFATTRCF